MLLGLGTMLQVGFPPSQEVGCDVALVRAVAAHHQPGWCQMLPQRWCLHTRSECPWGGCSGMLARGHVSLRGGRCGEEWRWPVSFGSLLLNGDPVSTSPGSGRCSRVSWGFRAATGAAGKFELQVSVAGKLPVPAVVPRHCRQAGWPLQTPQHTASHDGPAASLFALLVLRQCGAWLKVNATIQSHSPGRCSWPGEPRCESYMLAMARS